MNLKRKGEIKRIIGTLFFFIDFNSLQQQNHFHTQPKTYRHFQLHYRLCLHLPYLCRHSEEHSWCDVGVAVHQARLRAARQLAGWGKCVQNEGKGVNVVGVIVNSHTQRQKS